MPTGWGWSTHCIPAARFGEIRAGLADADTVDPLLDDRHEDPGPGELEALRPVDCALLLATTRWRASSTACGPSGALRPTWAQGVVVEDLAARSPTSLKITHRHVQLARDLDLRDTLIQDFRLACRCLEGEDLYEGVRAVLIDRDHAPGGTPRAWRM